MQQEVSLADGELRRLQSEFEAAVEERGVAITDEDRRKAVARAVSISGKLHAAEDRLRAAKRTLAKAQGDTYRRDEATPQI